ncbi:MAG: biotin/lipoyl-binding protein [Thermoclostridium sp.]|nr:biotin/lipoyl-binding protein [Thermoclostridium sp.]
MENGIFRKSSLDYISSPERLNEYIRITRPGLWTVLAGCLAILIAAGFWGFYGHIPDTVRATGMIFPQNGVASVIPTSGGRISDIRVKVGDFVEAGQIIAIIPQDDITEKINEMQTAGGADEAQTKALIAEYERKSIIISPVSGIVLSAKSINETVSSAEAIAGIVKQEKYADDRQVVTYIPASTAKKLKEGMEVQVSPDYAPREEYGYMLGHITSIGLYPVSQADVLSAVGNPQYAKGLLPEGNHVEVRITLTVDPNSRNKIKWSGRKGENLALTIGTNCNIQIIVNNYKPYELLFQ